MRDKTKYLFHDALCQHEWRGTKFPAAFQSSTFPSRPEHERAHVTRAERGGNETRRKEITDEDRQLFKCGPGPNVTRTVTVSVDVLF